MKILVIDLVPGFLGQHVYLAALARDASILTIPRFSVDEKVSVQE